MEILQPTFCQRTSTPPCAVSEIINQTATFEAGATSDAQNSWTPITSVIPPAGKFIFADANAAQFTARFYRMSLQSQGARWEGLAWLPSNVLSRFNLILDRVLTPFQIMRSETEGKAFHIITQFIFWTLMSYGTAALTATAFADPKPKLEESTLVSHNKAIHPDSFTTPWLPEYQTGISVLILSNSTITAWDEYKREVRWVATNAAAKEFRWLGYGGSVAYLESVQEKVTQDPSAHEPHILRLNLETGHWLTDIVLTGNKEPEVVEALIAQGDSAIVLSTTSTGESPFDKQLKSYRITRFNGERAAKKWSKSFDAHEEEVFRGPFLLSGRRPNAALAGIQNLNWIGEDILVCAGPKQKLIRLNGKTGEPTWVLDRLWEFQRGFIGPSVWSHFISRNGRGTGFDYSRQLPAEDRAAFDRRWNCSVIGGPIIAACARSEFGKPEPRIFVATSKAEKEGERGEWSRYLADCVVYELDASGKPLTMATLPRLVQGSEAQISDSGVVWNCQNNAMIKLRTLGESINFMGPGGPDLLTKIDWYREFVEFDSDRPWLVADKNGDPLAYSSNRVFRVTSGGYISSIEDKLYHFPISVIDYKNGMTDDLLLEVPLTEPVPKPETNYSGTSGHYHTLGPYLMAVTSLEVRGERLLITLATEKWSGVVTFDLSKFK